jgi:hypothetical protein
MNHITAPDGAHSFAATVLGLLRKLNSLIHDDFKHCITERCGIPFTSAHAREWFAALSDQPDYQTQKFRETCGDAHLERVIGWSEQDDRETQ